MREGKVKSIAKGLGELSVRELFEVSRLLSKGLGDVVARSILDTVLLGWDNREVSLGEESGEACMMVSVGGNRIGVIKELRSYLGISLREAKAITDRVPCSLGVECERLGIITTAERVMDLIGKLQRLGAVFE